jgi:hypothetical protein
MASVEEKLSAVIERVFRWVLRFLFVENYITVFFCVWGVRRMVGVERNGRERGDLVKEFSVAPARCTRLTTEDEGASHRVCYNLPQKNEIALGHPDSR